MYAAIDIGSNTVQLQIVETSKDGSVRQRSSWLRTTRMGSTDKQGLLTAAAIKETAAVIAEYMELIRAAGAGARSRIVATSAIRDAANRADLLTAIQAAAPDAPLPEIISGTREAELSFYGATAAAHFPKDRPVVDVGGASSELILPGKDSLRMQSANVGAVRALQQGWSEAEITQRLQEAYQPLLSQVTPGMVIGVGGTITTAAGVKQGLPSYQRAAIEGTQLTSADLEAELAALLPLSLSERCQFSPLLEKRGEIMVPGLWIWLSLLRILGCDTVLVAGGGILDGIIAEQVREDALRDDIFLKGVEHETCKHE